MLKQSVALTILAAVGSQALLIPKLDEIINVFPDEVGHKLQDTAADIKAEAAALKDHVSSATESIANSLSDVVAPLINADSVRELIPHKYIVVLKENASKEEMALHQEWVALQHANAIPEGLKSVPQFEAAPEGFKAEGGIVDSFDIDNIVKGYSGFFLPETILLIRRNPLVAFVELDSVVHASEFDIEKGAPWGLARVSHRQPLSLNSFNQYLYDSEAGKGVTAYVIDTGINVNHVEFGGRAKWGSTVPSGDADIDGNGHGTHCAGTIASETYGVAKKAEVVAVKVLRSNGSGSMSDVVKGVEFAAKSHQDAVKANKKGFKGSTANMSLGGGKSPALDLAVNAAVKAGLHFAVAAGNENQDACNVSPAAAENAITVGASTISDARAYFSNWGKCVDIFAPGLNVLSTYIGSDSATATLSGTSMASPHIAGLLSYYVSLQPGADSEYFVAANGVSPAQLKKNLIAFGTKGILTDLPEDTVNVLAFNGAGHNLTEFWGAGAQEALEAHSQPKISDELHILEEKMGEKLAAIGRMEGANEMVKQISDMVDDIYNKVAA